MIKINKEIISRANIKKHIRIIAFYASLTCHFVFASLATIFAWATHGCELAENYFEKQRKKYRR